MKIKVTQAEWDKIADDFIQKQVPRSRSLGEAMHFITEHMSKYKVVPEEDTKHGFDYFIKTRRFEQIKNWIAQMCGSEKGRQEYKEKYGNVSPIEAIKQEYLQIFPNQLTK